MTIVVELFVADSVVEIVMHSTTNKREKREKKLETYHKNSFALLITTRSCGYGQIGCVVFCALNRI